MDRGVDWSEPEGDGQSCGLWSRSNWSKWRVFSSWVFEALGHGLSLGAQWAVGLSFGGVGRFSGYRLFLEWRWEVATSQRDGREEIQDQADQRCSWSQQVGSVSRWFSLVSGPLVCPILRMDAYAVPSRALCRRSFEGKRIGAR